MPITELRIEGYRTLKDVTWRPGALNVLIGPNASGKTNVLRALQLILSSVNGGLSEFFLQEGGLEVATWNRSGSGVSFLLSWTHDEEVIGKSSYKYFVKIGSWYSASHRVTVEILKADDNKFLVRKENGEAYIIKQEGMVDVKGTVAHDETIVSQVGVGMPLEIWLAKEFFSWRTVLAIPTWAKADIRSPVVTRHETALDAQCQNLAAVIHTLYANDRDFKKSIDSAMQAAFGDDYEELSFPPAGNNTIQLAVRWKSLTHPQTMMDLSDGTIRFLCLITILLQPKAPSVIAVDEPEIGLHPRMFGIIADLAAEAAERTQVIFATHSPQFLDALGRHNPTTTVTSWEDGQTHLSILEAEQLSEWLQRYTLGQLFESGDLEALK